jgi:hypothetical protein
MADFTAINALHSKALAYASRNGFAHAAETWDEAVTVAQGLPDAPADSLVVLHLQALRSSALLSQSGAASASAADGCAQWVTAWRDVLLPTQAALTRRANAHTLLPGACHALEEAWYATQVPATAPAQLTRPPLRAQWAQLVGYAALLATAFATLQAVHTCHYDWLPAAELLMTSPRAFRFVERALEALMLPRPLAATPLLAEMGFVGYVAQFLGDGRSTPLPHIARVRDAWARVQRSGVLEERQLTNSSSHFATWKTQAVERNSAAAARAAQRGLRACALPSCGAREAHVAHFKLCGRCGTVAYCSREHQTSHWHDGHKAACKAAVAAAAEAAGAAAAAES